MENNTSDIKNPKVKSKKKSNFKSAHPVYFILLILVCIVCLFLSSGLLSYKYGVKNAYLDKITKIIPYPAIIVNNDIVPLVEYYQKYNMVAFFVKQQREITPEVQKELSQFIVDNLIHEQIIFQIAEDMKIEITNEELEEEKKKMLEEIGSTAEEIDKRMMEMYNMDFNTYFKEVGIIPIYQQKIVEHFNEDEERYEKAKKQAEEVLELTKKGNESFQDLAKKYSQDRFAEHGGKWGYVSKGILPKKVEEVAFQLEKGDISNVIQTESGYYIVKIDDKRENSEPEVLLYEIFIKAPDFEEFLMEYIKSSKVYRLVS